MYIKTRKKDEETITKNAYSEETGANQTKGAIVEAEKKKEAGLSWGAFFSFICLVFSFGLHHRAIYYRASFYSPNASIRLQRAYLHLQKS